MAPCLGQLEFFNVGQVKKNCESGHETIRNLGY